MHRKKLSLSQTHSTKDIIERVALYVKTDHLQKIESFFSDVQLYF